MKPNPSLSPLRPWLVFVLGLAAFASSGLRAQQAAQPAAVPSNTPATPAAVLKLPAAPTAMAEENVVQLSPFEVNSTRDRGYEASSTLSGTRLNSNIEDLAASISVVTKQQLQDTAAININDVFMYEANTEGTYQWTSFVNDRGTISDDIQANPTGANRMRGLSAANPRSTASPVPCPSTLTMSTRSKSPAAPIRTVFGLGNTGGGVNINLCPGQRQPRDHDHRHPRRQLRRLSRQLRHQPPALERTSSRFGCWACTIDKAFERKPSSEITRRLMTALTFRPFKNTTIRASFESYRDNFNRPNSTTPRDGISDWVANGKPTYDPIAQAVHFGNGNAPITGSHHGQRNRPVALARSNPPTRPSPRTPAGTSKTARSSFTKSTTCPRRPARAPPASTRFGRTSAL